MGLDEKMFEKMKVVYEKFVRSIETGEKEMDDVTVKSESSHSQPVSVDSYSSQVDSPRIFDHY